MEVLLFTNFNKRKNSTKKPNDSDGIAKQVVLKGECSVTHPTFFLADTSNYSYVKAWGNYYFIDSIRYDINGAQYIDCSIDVLATWKTQINATSAFVTYSTSNYNVNVKDSRVAQRVTLSSDAVSSDAPFVTTVDGGSYILSVFDQVTGMSHYAITKSQMDDLTTWLFNQGQTFWSDLQIQFGDAMGSIVGIRYVPIGREDLYDAELGAWNINLGTFPTDTSGYRITGYYYDTVTLQIPWIYNDFRRGNDFTRFYLVLPFLGTVEVNPENLIGATSIVINITCNVVTGSMIYVIRARSQIIATYTCEFGRQMATATDQIDSSGILKSGMVIAGSTFAGAAHGIMSPLSANGYGVSIGAISGAIAGVASAVMASNRHDVQTLGGFGGGFGEKAITRYYLITKAIDSQTEPAELLTLYGRPLNKVVSIGTLTGYVETMGFNIDISTISEIRETINKAMDSGVYLE